MSTKRISIGSHVRIASGAVLEAARRSGALRPEPGQMTCADKRASVVGLRRDDAGAWLYVLAEAPGLWSEEWLDPA